MPKRTGVDDFFAQLEDHQRPHLEALRALSVEVDPEAREVLKWNLPVYVRGENTNQWMLQNFKNHCSLRFSPEFFASQKAVVEAAGYEFGEGFIKLPYKRDLPTELLKTLMQARMSEFEAQHPLRRILNGSSGTESRRVRADDPTNPIRNFRRR